MKKIIFTFFLFLVFLAFTLSSTESRNFEFYRGNISIDELFKKYPLFKKSHDNHITSELSALKIDEIKVVIFFGTWCHDSKRELPKALRIFKDIGISNENIELIAVGLDKKEPLGRAAKLNLLYTPTIIFFRESNEIGRIIEKPVRSLEEDIESIISSI